jgi:5-methyltetrahydrofolate--homocysteine methyltransferase
VIRRFTGSVNAPLVIDSTETPVIEAALKLHGGKPIINSINFEDGEGRGPRPPAAGQEVRRRRDRADHRRGGHGQDAEDKLRIARRLVEFACTSTACRRATC